jgi:hypothetical protein
MTDAAHRVRGARAPAGNPPRKRLMWTNGSDRTSAKSWLDGLSEGNRKLAETKGWTTPESARQGAHVIRELEKLQGESLRPQAGCSARGME